MNRYNPKERSIEAKILALYVNNSFVNSVGPECPDLVGIVLDKVVEFLIFNFLRWYSIYFFFLKKTNFYAEAGGQVADVGTFQVLHYGLKNKNKLFLISVLKIDDTHVFDVADVQSFAGYVLHIGRVRKTAAPIEVSYIFKIFI